MSGTPQTRIDTFLANTVSSASRPQIETLPNGNFIVFYSTSEGGSGFFIKGQQFDAGGNAVGTEIDFDFGRQIEQREFDVFVQPDGNIVIAAETDRPNLSAPEMTVATFALNDGGPNQPIDEDFLDDVGVVDTSNPVIAGLGNGNYNVFSLKAFGSLFIGQKIGFHTVRGETITELDPSYEDESLGGRIFSDSDLATAQMTNGNTVLVIDRDANAGLRSKFDVRIYNSNMDELHTLQVGGGARTFDTTVEALANGGFVVAWSQLDKVLVRNNKQDTEVFVQVFDEDGNATSPKMRVGETRSNDNNTNASIVALEDGGFIVFYDKGRHDVGVNGQRYDANGTEIGEEFQVYAGRVGNIDATLLPDDRVAVSFETFGANVHVEILEFGQVFRGTEGADVFVGTDLADLVEGAAGDDTLRGEGGDDVINGGSGNDALDGGNGSDQFVFRDDDGQDEIIDFDALDDAEVIDLSAVTEITSFEDLAANHLQQQVNEVIIDDGAGLEITLLAVSVADLDANDFVF